MEDNVKLLGDDGMLGMEYKERQIYVFNTEGNAMNYFQQKNRFKRILIFLKNVKWK
ncbi:hypothetical protein DJ87_2263 [Bacillus cereus]|uniref:Uncharacterized protein n=2 Tax=Bacillus cereus group TaxID=86661 RepID=A0A7D8D669_9BACI|nr:hypothetical protein BCAH187_A2677 [Bacillus cereus AH187]EJQ00212.1 hypothetical protein IAU_00458 [Bacillus cereus IS075]EJQ06960.1 hypothetical protein IC5_01569 [Bacillus cereus AND1407]EJR17548.1 hypothetical protein II7_01732 [Bacillus cereus MSX-A12]EOO87915.1 hypothetical protein IGS_03802 [Bacillus cereus IS845/00]EOO96016.1 hypothetical protein IGQ_03559 [Bacillus cereus IS195]KFK74071.1 hypothetical protein DJ87_2263 [Bacillus cereus]TDT84169.1 hypothetical protein DEU41_1635 [